MDGYCISEAPALRHSMTAKLTSLQSCGALDLRFDRIDLQAAFDHARNSLTPICEDCATSS